MIKIKEVETLLREIELNVVLVDNSSVWRIEEIQKLISTFRKCHDDIELMTSKVFDFAIDFDYSLFEHIRMKMQTLYESIMVLYRDLKQCCSENPLHISNYDLSIRLYNVLMRGGIYTIDQIQSMDIKELAKVRNMGKKALREACQLVYNVLGDSTLLKAYDELYLDIDAIIEQIKEVNSKVNNRRVVLLINLASNKGATKGEKINSINLCKKILNI